MIEEIKKRIKLKLAKILAPEINELLNLNQKWEEVAYKWAEIDKKLELVNFFEMAPWYHENLWEPPVQIALRDLCKPGDIVFDIGANFAGLTTVMSRMVGAKGIVCAFEASPRIIAITQRNLILNGCNNVQLFHNAVYHTSQKLAKIYLGNHLNDSICSEHGDSSAYSVQTIALDDFVEHSQLIPNLVKMDIEGAEFDALKGFRQTLIAYRPHLILETHREDTCCLEFLRELGYIALDLNTYREIKSKDDYPVSAEIRNNLYIHSDRLKETPYQPPLEFKIHCILDSGDFQQAADGSIYSLKDIVLPKGRYLIDCDFVAWGTDNNLMCGIKTGAKTILRYHAYSQLLATSYKDWIIDLSASMPIQFYFEFQGKTYDQSLQVNGAKIIEICDFKSLRSSLYL